MILFILKMTGLLEKRNEYLQTGQTLIHSVRKVKGCTNCFACQDIEEESNFHLIEKWPTQRDLDRHLRSDLFDLLHGTKNFLSDDLEINFNTVSSTTGIDAIKRHAGKQSISKFDMISFWD